MFCKIIILAVAVSAACAQYQQGHGHATSSQSIVRHEGSHQQGHLQQQPIYQHQPIYHHVPVVHQAPVVHAPVHYVQQGHEVEHFAHPQYQFEYKVSDPHTGDNKYQQESRDGDVVKGVYSLHEADGSIRTVEYQADKHSGFNAQVHNSAPSNHAQPQQEYHH